MKLRNQYDVEELVPKDFHWESRFELKRNPNGTFSAKLNNDLPIHILCPKLELLRFYEIEFINLPLSVRSSNVLLNAGIETVWQFANLTFYQFCNMKNGGDRVMSEVLWICLQAADNKCKAVGTRPPEIWVKWNFKSESGVAFSSQSQAIKSPIDGILMRFR